jgi:hypothetical protein
MSSALAQTAAARVAKYPQRAKRFTDNLFGRFELIENQ